MRKGEWGARARRSIPREHPLPCRVREFQPGMSIPISKDLIGSILRKKNVGDRVSRELPEAAWLRRHSRVPRLPLSPLPPSASSGSGSRAVARNDRRRRLHYAALKGRSSTALFVIDPCLRLTYGRTNGRMSRQLAASNWQLAEP